jgi:hypothetical protein
VERRVHFPNGGAKAAAAPIASKISVNPVAIDVRSEWALKKLSFTIWQKSFPYH